MNVFDSKKSTKKSSLFTGTGSWDGVALAAEPAPKA